MDAAAVDAAAIEIAAARKSFIDNLSYARKNVGKYSSTV